MPTLTRNQRLARTGMLAAVTLVLILTPLGYIRLTPGLELTFIVTPVIIGGLLDGWPSGLFLGIVFGLSSFFKAFSDPLGAIMLTQSGILTFLACLAPRAAVGLFGGLLHGLLRRIPALRNIVFYAAAGLLGSLLNTAGFLGFVALAFDQALTQLTWAVVWGVVSFNGLIEAGVNTVLVAMLTRVLLRPAPKKKAPGNAPPEEEGGQG